jgi:hypothetical protein
VKEEEEEVHDTRSKETEETSLEEEEAAEAAAASEVEFRLTNLQGTRWNIWRETRANRSRGGWLQKCKKEKLHKF